jgi:hypothetical protein
MSAVSENLLCYFYTLKRKMKQTKPSSVIKYIFKGKNPLIFVLVPLRKEISHKVYLSRLVT